MEYPAVYRLSLSCKSLNVVSAACS